MIFTQQSAYKSIFENKMDLVHKTFGAHLAFLECRPPFAAKHKDFSRPLINNQGPVVQSVVSLTSSLRVVSLTVLADSLQSILIFFAEKMYLHFFSKKFQHICVSLDVNFNESLTNNIVSFEQLGPDYSHLG